MTDPGNDLALANRALGQLQVTISNNAMQNVVAALGTQAAFDQYQEQVTALILSSTWTPD